MEIGTLGQGSPRGNRRGWGLFLFDPGWCAIVVVCGTLKVFFGNGFVLFFENITIYFIINLFVSFKKFLENCSLRVY